MGESWGQAIRLPTEDERAIYARPGWGCAGRGCTEPVEFFTSYRYVTGRRGRVSFAERRACKTHAEKFAEKHGLKLPEIPRKRPSQM